MSNNVFKSYFVSIAEMKKTIPVLDEENYKVLNIDIEESHEELAISEEKSSEDYDNLDLDTFELSESIEEENKYIEDVKDEVYAELNAEESLPSMTLKLAREEAELLMNDAKLKAVEMQKEAKEKGYEEGILLGEQKYKQELELEKARIIEKEKQLELDFVERLKSYEPKIASIIAKLVTQLVGSSSDENIILFLVRLALAENTAKGKVVINVSKDDFENLRQHFEDDLGKDDNISIEIKKNENLVKNDCLLETDFGVIDSSLSIRLDSFLKEIKVIQESLKNIDDV